MHPVLFRVGSFEVTSFGVMLAIAAIVALAVFRHEVRWQGLPNNAIDAGAVGLFGGLLGAKVLWTVEHLGSAPWADLLFSRGGLSWYGGLIGGVAAGLGYVRSKRWSIVAILSAATPALAVGHLIGRIGCFLVGDDYGLPSDLPWAVAFPEGLPPTSVPVHPTQLYEAGGLAVLFWLLVRSRRRGVTDAAVVGRYLVGAGSLRFIIQFIRVSEPVAVGLSLAHLISLLAITVGVAFCYAGSPRRPIG